MPSPSGLRLLGLGALGIVALGVLFVIHAAGQPLRWGDHYWQVRTGLDILATGVLPDRETRSFTVPGVRWNNHEWGYEVLVALAWKLGGWGAIRALVVLWIGGALGALLVRWWRAGAPLAVAAVLLVTVASLYKFNPAPQTASFAFGVAGWILFARGDLLDRPGRLAALGLFSLVWGNVSAEALSWLVLLALTQLPVIVRRGSLRPALPLALALALVLVNPPQSSVIEYALVGSAINREVNDEFRHLWEPSGTLPLTAHVAVVATIALWLVWAARRVARAYPAERAVVALELLPGLAAIASMVIFQRFTSLIFVPLDLALRQRTGVGDRPHAPDFGVGALATALVLGVATTRDLGWTPSLALGDVGTARWWTEHLDPHANPVACDGALAALPPGARVFSSRAWGNYLHMAAPQVRVFIDGRNREFPVALHAMAREAAAGGPRTRAILDQTGAEYVLADAEWAARAGLTDAWRPNDSGPNCAVYARTRTLAEE